MIYLHQGQYPVVHPGLCKYLKTIFKPKQLQYHERREVSRCTDGTHYASMQVSMSHAGSMEGHESGCIDMRVLHMK